MMVNQKEPQAKDFLDRADIVTMRKDIKRLREADAFKESAKITTAPAINQRPLGPNLNFSKKVPGAQVSSIQPPIPQKVAGDKTNATEEEKQKIFLLESRRAEIEKQIQLLNEKTPAIDTEKRGIQKEKESWQNRLNPLIETQKTGTEEQKQTAEKERWPIETELGKVENRIKDIDAKYKESQTQKGQLNQKITQIDNSLKEIYSGIEKRIKEAEKAKQATDQQPIIPPVKPKIEKQMTAPIKESEKPYLKNVSVAAKEKLAESLSSEEQQRRKFLEDIDKWASFHNNQEK